MSCEPALIVGSDDVRPLWPTLLIHPFRSSSVAVIRVRNVCGLNSASLFIYGGRHEKSFHHAFRVRRAVLRLV